MKDVIKVVVNRRQIVDMLLRSPGLKLSLVEAELIVDILEIRLRASNDDCEVVEE